MANDPTVRISALEELEKRMSAIRLEGALKPEAIMELAGALRDLRALLARAREEEKPLLSRPSYMVDGMNPPASAGEPIVIGRASFASPASAGTRLCPEKHGAEREMELQWVCETCGHRESAEEMEAAGTEREPGTPYLRTALVAAKGVIDIAASYDPEEWPTVGLKVHCRDARKVKAIIDDALAANPAGTEGPLSEDAIAAILGRYLQLSMDNHAEYQTSKHHAGKWDDCTEIGCNNDRYLIGRLRAALVERREEMSLRRSTHHGTGYTEESAEEFARDFKEWFGLSIAEADVTSKTDRRKPATPPASAGTEVPGLREVAWAFLKDNPDASALSLFVALFPGTITEDDIRWAKAAVARTLAKGEKR